MKNKKILGALAALCMGVILCVSSVFAVNYWYDIHNNDNENTVTMGNALELTLNDVTDEALHLYPGGYATFANITVEGAEEWLNDNTNVTNVTLPQFALRVKAAACTAADGETDLDLTPFTVYYKLADGDAWAPVVADANTLGADLLILDDLQTVGAGEDIVLDIRIAFAGTAGKEYAQSELTFTLEIVAYTGTAYAADKVFADSTGVDLDGIGVTIPNGEDIKSPLA